MKDRRRRQIDAEVLNAATDAFVASRRFNMIERNQLERRVHRESLQDFIGGKVNNKLSDVLDLDLIGIVGYTVENHEVRNGEHDEWIIDVRLVDVKTAALLATVTSDRATSWLLPPATPREAGALLAQSIREAFPPLGYVVRIDGKDIVVDLGSEAGLKKGDTLEIVQEGRTDHPSCHRRVLSAPLKVIGELKVVSASPQVAICKPRPERESFKWPASCASRGPSPSIVKWIMKVPRIIDEDRKKKEAVEVEH